MNLPDRVFAVGNAGKQIAYELLESDWILREALRPRVDPHNMTVTVLDTAEGERETDAQRINDIRERIHELKSELRDVDAGRVGDIDIQYKLITDNVMLNSGTDLLGDAEVDRIAGGNGMDPDDWWVQDQHINENLDFAKGVIRKRGLGKAIYYKAYAEDDQISRYIDLPNKSQVAVFAGLAGGTGSGVVIDLARHLKQQMRTADVTLFGILPNHTEGTRENANAYAVLSELERLSLDEEVFKDQILVPIAPTGYEGERGNTVQYKQKLEEFDEALVYLVATYYSVDTISGLEDPFQNTPEYAPFTIGIPQILRFKVEEIKTAQDSVKEIIDLKSDSLTAEEEVYNRLERFLTRYYDLDQDYDLTEVDELDIEERLTELESLLDVDLFVEMDYTSLEIFEEEIATAKQQTDDITEQVEIISGSIGTVDITEDLTEGFVGPVDRRLAETLEQDLILLNRRVELLGYRNDIDDDTIRTAVNFLLDAGDSDTPVGVRLAEIETRLDEMSEQRARLKDELADVEDELEEAREEQDTEVRRTLDDWERAVSSDLDRLQTISSIDIQSDLQRLQNSLDGFRNEVVNAESEDELQQLATVEIVDTLDTIESKLDRIGVDMTSERQTIEQSVDDLKQAKEEFLKINQEETLGDKLRPWQSKTEQEKEEALKNYRRLNNKLGDRGVFSVGSTENFTAQLQFEPERIQSTVRDRRRSSKQRVTDELRSRVDDPTPELMRELEAEVDGQADADVARDIAEEIIREEMSGTDDIEARRDELQAELDDVTEDIDVYEEVHDLFNEFRSRRKQFVEQRESYRTQRREEVESSDDTLPAASQDHSFIKKIEPENILQLQGEMDIQQSELLTRETELQRAQSALEDLVDTTLEEPYHGLRRRKLELTSERSRYDELRVRVGVLSRARNQLDTDTLDFRGRYADAFDLGPPGQSSNPYTTWSHDVADSWDIGLGVFIQGVFLDNIKKMVRPDGYADGYESRRSQIGDDILIHHSYGLEEGRYVRRADTVNIEHPDGLRFYLQDETEIVRNLREEYFETVYLDEIDEVDDTDEAGPPGDGAEAPDDDYQLADSDSASDSESHLN